MELDVSDSNVLDLYQALVGIVTPRPIAWVSTLNENGAVNLAPFSFYNVFCANPPVVVFSPVLHRDGRQKDTLRNVIRTGEFVVNVATEELAERVNLSSKELAEEESELEWLGLHARSSKMIRTPGVLEAPASMECVVDRVIPIGQGAIAANLVIGVVVHLRIDDTMLGPDGRPDPTRLRTIGRLGGNDFCRSTSLFQLARP